LEAQLNHKSKMDAIGQLSAGLAHDFNNILAGILGASQVLRYSNNNLSDKDDKLLEIISTSSLRASELTSRLLAFGRKGKIDSTIIDMHNIIRETFDILKRSIDKRISLCFNDGAEVSTVMGDESSLQNAVMNIAINASQAMPHGGKISISTSNVILTEEFCGKVPFDVKPGDYLKITIEDTGIGIPEQIIENIFDPFFTTKEKGKGTGLGLAAVYSIMENHHGIVTVESEVNHGALFTLFIPSLVGEIAARSTKKELIPGTGTILLVDDEEIILSTGKIMLEHMGYTVLTAVNGLDAVEQYKEHQNVIDLVVMDMVMPEMNGKDAFVKMKEHNPLCKVVISSGFTSDDIGKMRKEGLLGFIQKPFNDDDLSKIVSEALKS
jgi:CheY-like chemotaxis protein